MKNLLVLLSILFCAFLSAQEIGRFTLHTDKEYFDAPVSIALHQFNYNMDAGTVALYEISSGKEEYMPCQLETGHSPQLWFILKDVSDKKMKRKFVIKRQMDRIKSLSQVEIKKDARDIKIQSGDSPVLNYRFATTYPPENINPLYKRSGFIHPLCSPEGEILTRIQPPDHYHHYGIWGPWTLTHIDNRKVDFWNLAEGEGTVRFAEFISEVSGDVFSGFKVLQQHIDFGNKGADQIAMNELLDVRVWNAGTGVWIIDYTKTLNSPLSNGIMLDAYRYGGGIGFRATEKWTKDNSSVLTSEGKNRTDADGSRARWCIVEGESDAKEGRSGILFMSHPSNRMHPEPMRVWPLDANGGRGDMFFEFTPIRYESWQLKPSRDYTLKYRMVVFDGKMDEKAAETYWINFAQMPKIEYQ